MQNFDFSVLLGKYPLLNREDVSFLNNFFNGEKIQNILSEIEGDRMIGILKITVATFIFVFVLIFSFNFFNKLGLINSDNDAFGYVIGVLLVFYIGYVGLIIHRFSSSIKGKVLSKMMDSTSFGVKYSYLNEYFKDSIKTISRDTKLVKSYDRLDKKEDSIEIDDKDKGYNITGLEFSTSKKSTDSKGRTNYTTNNHAYLMKIKFYNPKYLIKSKLTILTQKNTNYLLIYVFLIAFFLFLYFVFKNFIVFIVALIVFGIVSFFTRIEKKSLIKLENIEFEERFNVYGDDEIEARRILTPSFMYKIYDYVNKINENRLYDFHFEKDFIYISYRMPGDFLEISFFKSLFKNIQDYVEFYLELKNISELAGDLKLSFYDKEFSINNVIK